MDEHLSTRAEGSTHGEFEGFRLVTLRTTHPSSDVSMRRNDAAVRSTTSAKEQRTPRAIEVLLRRYNQQGITNWNEILERLKEEDASFRISRSTLGEYLKECNIGTSRKNQASHEDKREVVLLELKQPRSQKYGVRKVWKNLKAKGHHITRDFVEKVMKEVDPKGFSERRPVWTHTAPGSHSTHLVPATRLDSPPPNHSDLPSISHSFSYPTHSEVQMQAYPVHSSATAELPQMVETQYMTVESTHDSDIQTGLAVGLDEMVIQPGNSGISANDDCAPETSIRVQIITCAEGVSLITFRTPMVDAIEDAEGNADDTNSVSTTSCESKLDDLWDEEVFPLISDPPPPGFWKAMANASVEDQITQIRRLELKNAVRDLLVQLDGWFDAAVDNETTQPAVSFVSGTLEEHRSHEDVQRSRYTPDYNVSEGQVTKDALSMVLNLQRTLLRRKTLSDIVEVFDQLWGVFGRLEDIGMGGELLAAVAFKHMRILKRLEKAFGREQWILQDLRGSAACFINYSRNCSDACDMALHKAEEIAAISARALLSIETTTINKALSLYYTWRHKGNFGSSKPEVVESLQLLQHALVLDRSNVCLLELMWAIFRLSFGSDTVTPHYLESLYASKITSHPVLLGIYANAVRGRVSKFKADSARNLTFRLNSVIDNLRGFQSSRPSQVQLYLASALEACEELQRRAETFDGSYHAHREAVKIRSTAANFGDIDALVSCESSWMNLFFSFHGDPPDSPLRCRDAVEMLHTSSLLMDSFPPADLPNANLCGDYSDDVWYFLPRIIEGTMANQTSDATPLFDCINNFRPFLLSKNYYTVKFGLCLMSSLCSAHRSSGLFESALALSREALLSFRKNTNSQEMLEKDKRIYHKLLECHVRSLFDNGQSEEAIRCFKKAMSNEFKIYAFSQFPIVYAFQPQMFPFGWIEDKIVSSMEIPGFLDPFEIHTPIWLQLSFRLYSNDPSQDEVAWILLLYAILRSPASRVQGIAAAEKSLTLMEQYRNAKYSHHDPDESDQRTSIFASILGNEYILTLILGQQKRGEDILNDLVTCYGSLLQKSPHMARLPLLVLLEILFILSRTVPLMEFSAVFLQEWRKKVYSGSTSFFDQLVAFLRTLPGPYF